MADEPAYIRNFKAFAKSDVTFNDLPALESEMYGTNDRATAIMMSAVTETCLEIFLREKTRPTLSSEDTAKIFDFRGPLGDFSSKTMLAYAFNMFGPDTKHDLELIRMLRNEWAHSRRSFGFHTKEVSDVCKHLRAVDWPGAKLPDGYLRAMPEDQRSAAMARSNPKTRYVTTCHTIAERLLWNAGEIPPGAATPDLR